MFYKINPKEIYKLHSNGKCSLISKTNINYKFTEFSGGSSAIITKKGYLAIGHSYSKNKVLKFLRLFRFMFNKPNLSRVYQHYFYIFQKHPPFNLINVSKPFYFYKFFY